MITVFEKGYVSDLATGPFVCSFCLLLILYSRCFSPIQLNFKMRFPVQVEDRSPGASTPPGDGGVSPPRKPASIALFIGAHIFVTQTRNLLGRVLRVKLRVFFAVFSTQPMENLQKPVCELHVW